MGCVRINGIWCLGRVVTWMLLSFTYITPAKSVDYWPAFGKIDQRWVCGYAYDHARCLTFRNIGFCYRYFLRKKYFTTIYSLRTIYRFLTSFPKFSNNIGFFSFLFFLFNMNETPIMKKINRTFAHRIIFIIYNYIYLLESRFLERV